VTDFRTLLAALATGGVKFIIVGGAAATAHGSARLTFDLDVVYERSGDNLHRLASSLTPYEPYLRGAPAGLPFTLDADTLQRGLNFTLITSIGAIDLLGIIAGGGDYAALEPRSIEMVLFGHRCLVVGLDALIDAKRAAGRPKDMEALAELEALREESRASS
jgi:hypothetical protein